MKKNKCKTCGKIFFRYYIGKYCSHKCYWKAMSNGHYNGKRSSRWKGGGWDNGFGYICMGNSKIKYLQHRLIMENHLGRKLKSDEHIHHINGIKADNRIENLKLVSKYSHKQEHAERIEIDGIKKTRKEWSNIYKLSIWTIYRRTCRGLPIIKAITYPKHQR